MNFSSMPELDSPWGYPIALGAMGVFAFVLYRVFKAKNWL